MKNLEKNINLQQVLNYKGSENVNLNKPVQDNCVKDIKRKKISFINQIRGTLKSLYNSLLIGNYYYEYQDEFTKSNITSEITSELRSNITLQKKEVIAIVINNFDDKYTYPFLLNILGYSDEEIASILLTPTNTV